MLGSRCSVPDAKRPVLGAWRSVLLLCCLFRLLFSLCSKHVMPWAGVRRPVLGARCFVHAARCLPVLHARVLGARRLVLCPALGARRPVNSIGAAVGL